MEGKLIIPIEADITQFKAAFAEANKIVSDFNAQLGRSGATSSLFTDNSIGILITKISELEIQVAKLKKQFDDLKKSGTDSFEKVANSASNAGKSIDVSKPINKTVDAAAKGRQTLTAFSLVAQDLPFGFIAIQNNLPNLIQYFGELKTQAGSTGGAFKQLGGALLGAGGIYFAFSAITAAVSFAIKEYGSLGNAIDALFGKLDPLYKVTNRAKESFDEYNKSVITAGEATAQAFGKAQGDVIKVETLSKAVLDLTNSEEIRRKALSQLQTIDKERFKSFDVEKGKLEGLKAATEEYTNAVIANGVAQQFQIQAISAATNYETQLNLFNQLVSNLKEQERLYPGIADEAERYAKALKNYADQTQRGIIAPPPQIPKYADILGDYITLDSRVKAVSKDVEAANEEVERTKKLYQDAINAANKFWRIPTEESKKIKPVKVVEINEASINSYKNLFDVLKIRQEERNNMLKEEKKLITDNFKLPQINPPSLKMSELLSFDIQKKREDFIQQLEETKKNLEEMKNFMDDIFFTPLQNSFEELLTTGKTSFSSLTKSIGEELKKMAAKIIASGIVSTLAVLFSGGFSAAQGGAANGFGQVLKLVGKSLGFSSGSVAAPQFGGIQGGGMQLAGEVVFVQRGTELVGVLNRTNASINRVG